MNIFGYRISKIRKEYNQINYSSPGTPEENAQKLEASIVEGNEWMRDRDSQSAEILGHLFSGFLQIEHKLELLLNDFYPEIKDSMFGHKLNVFKDFLNELKKTCPYEIDTQYYKNMLAPLKQIKKLRDTLAHDVTVVNPSSIDLNQVHRFIKKNKPQMHESISTAENENLKAVAVIATFSFIFSAEIGRIRLYLK